MTYVWIVAIILLLFFWNEGFTQVSGFTGVDSLDVDETEFQKERGKIKNEVFSLDYEIDDLLPDNKVCGYQTTSDGQGSFLILHEKPTDLSRYYEAPIHLPSDLKDNPTQELDRYWEPPFSFDSKETLSDLLSEGKDIQNLSYTCYSQLSDIKDNFRIIRPDQLTRRINMTKDIPCTEPSLPWLEDPSFKDKRLRPYCKSQREPCELCGKFSDDKIYQGDIGGPNRVPAHT